MSHLENTPVVVEDTQHSEHYLIQHHLGPYSKSGNESYQEGLKEAARAVAAREEVTSPKTGILPAVSATASGGPLANPKHIRAQKDGKTPLEYLIYSVLADEAHVLKHGADKYGVRNWRQDAILASTYEGAMLRHFLAWAMGEDTDPDSGYSHLIHLRACAAVCLDAQKAGTFIDDRDRQESKDA